MSFNPNTVNQRNESAIKNANAQTNNMDWLWPRWCILCLGGAHQSLCKRYGAQTDATKCI